MQYPAIPHTLKLIPLALALGLAIAMPAQAAVDGDPCWVFNTTTNVWEPDPAIDRTQGNEHGDRNSTCTADASAYGEGNNAGELVWPDRVPAGRHRLSGGARQHLAVPWRGL